MDYQDKNKQYYKKVSNSEDIFTKRILLVGLFALLVMGILWAVSHFDIFSKDTPKGMENILSKRKNVLVLGVDSNTMLDGTQETDPFLNTRSDTILLLSIDPTKNSVNVVSIPRDSKVFISGHSEEPQKINAAHSIGGAPLTVKTVEKTLGVRIDNYMVFNNTAVRHIVDTLGGVPLFIDRDMTYRDSSAGLDIHLQRGLNVLDGKQAEEYLRFRADGLGDIGRTYRQQWFLKNIVKKFQTPSVIAKIPELIQILNEYVKTDMSVYEMAQFIGFAKSLDLTSLQVATLPGDPSQKGGLSYWIIDPEKAQDVVDKFIYREKTVPSKKELDVNLFYSTENTQKATLVEEKLTMLGYKVNKEEKNSLPHSQIIVYSTEVSGDYISWIRKKIPALAECQFVYNPHNIYSNSDLTIILANS